MAESENRFHLVGYQEPHDYYLKDYRHIKERMEEVLGFF
jgi:hypothetical protein